MVALGSLRTRKDRSVESLALTHRVLAASRKSRKRQAQQRSFRVLMVHANGQKPMKNPTEYIFQLIAEFPCLSKKMGTWRPVEFDADLFYAMLTGASHGEILCGLFVLNVWNPGYAAAKGWVFDITDFAGTATFDNRVVVMKWLADPVWP
jgi:hypothetical protein